MPPGTGPYRVRSMHGHARSDGVGLTLLVDREGWTRLALVDLVDGRLAGPDARVAPSAAAAVRERVGAAAALLRATYDATIDIVGQVQPVDAPLTIALHAGTALVDGGGIWLTMDTFGEGRARAWLNLGSFRDPGTWGDQVVIAALLPVGQAALVRLGELLMADRSAHGPGLGALPEL